MQEKRSRKEQRRDRQQHYEELESRHDAKALERFKRPAYQSVSVAEYLARKYDIHATTLYGSPASSNQTPVWE